MKVITFLLSILIFIRELFRLPAARAANAQESVSIAIGRSVATFVAKLSGESLSFGGDTFYSEDELLSPPELKSERGNRHMAADGSRSATIYSMTRNGTRDIKFLLGDNLDRLVSWGQARIPVAFDFDFLYQRDLQSATGTRIQRHKNCFFVGIPVPGIGKDQGYVTAKIDYEDIAEVDPLTDKEL